MNLQPWSLVDRRLLRREYREFTERAPGLLLVVGSDDDGRRQACDVLCAAGIADGHHIFRIPGRSDRGRSANDLLREALVACETPHSQSTTFGLAVLGADYLSTVEVQNRLKSRLAEWHDHMPSVFVFDTVDTVSRFAPSEFRMIDRAFKAIGGHCAIFLRRESASIVPATFRRFELGELERPDILWSLEPKNAHCQGSDLTELRKLVTLLFAEDASTDPIPAVLAYDFLEEEWSR